ncbi:hypothetical protein PLESTB_001769700 [Pleodorina starrii]|uniref:Apple domain-containing protein n=1 Tax=Pleodorina starrii TaxID=330485 RepID=A0A9W6FA93_9CHLO|nr:hypothetical protein PLESTB_001769700 [Pleodorina starrii]
MRRAFRRVAQYQIHAPAGWSEDGWDIYIHCLHYLQSFAAAPSSCIRYIPPTFLYVLSITACTVQLQYGARYGNDSAVLATSTEPDEGACCQACYVSSTCVYWDWERSTGICRLKPNQGGSIPEGQLIPGFWRDPTRVAGAKQGE